MVEPKQKQAHKPVHTADQARSPRTAMRAVWLRTREGARQLVTEERRDGQYQDATDQEERAIDAVSSLTESAAGAALRGGKKLARQTARRRQSEKAARQTAQTAEQAMGTENQTMAMPAESNTQNAGDSLYYGRQNSQSRPARRQISSSATQMNVNQRQRSESANLQQSHLRRDSSDHFKLTTRKRPRQAPPPKTAQIAAKKAADANKARKKAARAAQRAKQAAQAAKEMAKKVVDAVMAGLKALWAATQTLVAAIAAGGTTAVIIIVIICMIALVLGSAFGIFFASESTGSGISIQEAVTQLNGEYQNRLEEIETTVPHDRQEIESNDGSYAIAWQDVLAVFAARTSGAEDGMTVAIIDAENMNRLREILWDMNAVAYRTDTSTHDVEVPDEDGNTTTTTVTETVLTIELTHKTAEEMRTEYAFNERQNEYLTQLSSSDTAELWGQLLGGFASGGGEIMAPSDGWHSTGNLQWPLTIAGTITSQFGYRTDPISGETSYHSGTDIAAPAGSPILAAADGTVTIANALDSWGGSYGYYVRIDHGDGLETLYAHCSSICVTVGQQVQAGQVIAYVGRTGRATGNHLHFEVYQDGQRGDAMSYFTAEAD